MMQEYCVKTIARIHNGFAEKFGIPRQSNLVNTPAVIVFEPEYRNEQALRGLEQFDRLWLVWVFSEFVRGQWSPTVRPPRLGGNQRVGVFATRSPNRPNPIGLSCVKIEKIVLSSEKGPLLYVSGADLMDGTPILDIKPYLPYADSFPQASGGFAEEKKQYALAVEFARNISSDISTEEKEIITALLSQDPRPAYQEDATRIYTMTYNGWNIRFLVDGAKLTVTEMFR